MNDGEQLKPKKRPWPRHPRFYDNGMPGTDVPTPDEIERMISEKKATYREMGIEPPYADEGEE